MVGLSEATLKPLWALEIKWTNIFFDEPGELKSLFKFCAESGLNKPVVTTIDKEGEQEYKGLNIQFLPAYTYTIGRNTLEKKQIKKPANSAGFLIIRYD